MKERFFVIGGGPAGAGAALLASKLGYKVIVYEGLERLAFKPCGNALPLVPSLMLQVPKDAILNRIKRARVFVDGAKAFETKGFVEGVEGIIVDKALLLEKAFADAGAEVVFRAKYDISKGVVRAGETEVKVEIGVFAGGFPYYDGDKVPIVQTLLSGVKDFEKDSIEIYYDSNLIGYYYVFPYGDDVEVGVGGYVSSHILTKLLQKFIELDERLRRGKARSTRFSQVCVGGPKPGYLNKLVKVGEAAGYVFPLTGEGIRPAVASGYIAAKALIEGKNPIKELERSWVHKAVTVQKRLLEISMSLSPKERGELIKKLSAEEHAEIVLATFRTTKLVVAFLKLFFWKPGLALSVARALR
ncbi:MAG: NAD(P)/FAD-dependent oxidoreductase [Acidilobaceae archaeon]